MMAYDPKEPRDKSGKWTTGGRGSNLNVITGGKGHNAGKGNKSVSKRIAAQHKAAGVHSLDTQEGLASFHAAMNRKIGPAEAHDRLMRARETLFKIMKGNRDSITKLPPKSKSVPQHTYDFWLKQEKKFKREHAGKTDAQLRAIAAKSYPSNKKF